MHHAYLEHILDKCSVLLRQYRAQFQLVEDSEMLADVVQELGGEFFA